jgi:hypothetical protein
LEAPTAWVVDACVSPTTSLSCCCRPQIWHKLPGLS